MDHDQRRQNLLQERFADLLRWVVPQYADRFDLNTVEFSRQEHYSNPPAGERQRLDIIAKLQRRSVDGQTSGAEVVVIFVEPESKDSTTDIKSRLPGYYRVLKQKYDCPVLPIVVYQNVALQGMGIDTVEEYFEDTVVLVQHYFYLGLPGLNAVDYLEGENWLAIGLTSLMRTPPEQMIPVAIRALNRIEQSPLSNLEKYHLTECVQAYTPLTEELKAIHLELEKGKSMAGFIARNKTWSELYIEEEMPKRMLELGKIAIAQATGKLAGSSIEPVSGHRYQKLLDDLTEQLLGDMKAKLAEHMTEPAKNPSSEQIAEELNQRLATQRTLVQKLLEKRFGPLTPGQIATVQAKQFAELDELQLRLLDAPDLASLGIGD